VNFYEETTIVSEICSKSGWKIGVLPIRAYYLTSPITLSVMKQHIILLIAIIYASVYHARDTNIRGNETRASTGPFAARTE
jgi:hypothetical protein